MARLQNIPQPTTPSHLVEERDSRGHESGAVFGQHPAEVILLEMLPQPLNVVELLGSVSRKPEHSDPRARPFDLLLAALRGMS